VTRVLPAFVAALLAIAPSASGALHASAQGTWVGRAAVLARESADGIARDRTATDLSVFGRPRGEGFYAPEATEATLLLATNLSAHDRIVDGRALARRTFATRRVASHASDDEPSPRT
jgi:hypothetical protein